MTLTTGRNARRVAAAAIASALSLSALSVSPLMTSPASAATFSHTDGASVTVSDVIAVNGSIHLEGTGWKNATKGSTIAVKLDGSGTQPTDRTVTNPATNAAFGNVWAIIQAGADGSFSADIPYPTATNTSPAIAADAWAIGTTHTLNLLSGSLQPGDTGRGVPVSVTVGGPTTGTATTNASGQVTVAVSGSGFTTGEIASVFEGDTRLQWSSGRPATLKDTIAANATGAVSANVIFAPGTKPAGSYTLTVKTDKGTVRTVAYTVAPSIAFSAGTVLGATGEMTLGNVAAGATINSVKLGDLVLATNLTADASGKVTAPYSFAKAMLGTHVISMDVAGTIYTVNQKISPDETPFAADQFTISSNGEGIFQGLYQSAYSAKENALFAAAASGTGTAEDGYLYKLNPDTLQVIKAVHPKELTDPSGEAGHAPYGVGLDDVNGHVWVSNTRTNALAIYSTSDLSLVKQFPAGTLTHTRDLLFDETTNQVFVTSASEGTSGNGAIMVLEASDNDGDGVPFEIIKTIDTGARTSYSPMSLDAANGFVYSPSLQSNKIAKVNAKTLEWEFLEVTGIKVGGRGASGLAVNPANDQLFVAIQNSDEVVIADGKTGKTIREIPTGAGALNVKYDPTYELAYVSNFGGTSVTVLDAKGDKVASLPIAKANHISIDGKGNAFAVDKAAGNKVWKLTPKFETPKAKAITAAQKVVATATTAVSKAQAEVTAAQKKYTTAKAAVTKDNAKISTLTKKIKALKAKKKLKATTKAKQLKALNKQLSSAKKSLAKNKKTLTSTQKSWASAKTKLVAAQSTLTKAKAALAALTK